MVFALRQFHLAAVSFLLPAPRLRQDSRPRILGRVDPSDDRQRHALSNDLLAVAGGAWSHRHHMSAPLTSMMNGHLHCLEVLIRGSLVRSCWLIAAVDVQDAVYGIVDRVLATGAAAGASILQPGLTVW